MKEYERERVREKKLANKNTHFDYISKFTNRKDKIAKNENIYIYIYRINLKI